MDEVWIELPHVFPHGLKAALSLGFIRVGQSYIAIHCILCSLCDLHFMFQHGSLVLAVERRLDDLYGVVLVGDIRGETIELEPLVGLLPQLRILLLH